MPVPASPLPPSFMAGAAMSMPFPAENRAAYSVYDPVLFEILEVDPREFAEQMTLVDASYFLKIQASELLSLAWTGPDKWERAPNVVTFTQRFNNMTLWVCHEVLESTNPRRRAEKVAHFINIAKACNDLNNLNGLKSILAGLQSTPIHRLAKTWALVKSKDKATFEKLTELMASDNNSERYRKRLMAAKTAAIPFLGLHLSDLTFVSEAGKATTDRQEREAQMRSMVELLLSFQGPKYDSLRPLPAAAEFLSSPKFIAELLPFYEQENYRISLALEPKESAVPAGTPVPSPRDAAGSSPMPSSAVGSSESSGRGFFGGTGGFFRASKAAEDVAPGSAGRTELGRNGSIRRGEMAGTPPVRGGETPISAAAPAAGPRKVISLLDDSEIATVGDGDGGFAAGGSAVPGATATATSTAASTGPGGPPTQPQQQRPLSQTASMTPITYGQAGDSASDNDGSDYEDGPGAAADPADGRGPYVADSVPAHGCGASDVVAADRTRRGSVASCWVRVGCVDHRAHGMQLVAALPIQLDGRLVKKDLSLNWKRARNRGWNAYWAVLQHPHLLLFKDRGSMQKSTRDQTAKHVLTITAESFADVASDYKKRRYVFRVMPTPGTEMLFEARNDDDMDAWLVALDKCVNTLKHPQSHDMISMAGEGQHHHHHHHHHHPQHQPEGA